MYAGHGYVGTGYISSSSCYTSGGVGGGARLGQNELLRPTEGSEEQGGGTDSSSVFAAALLSALCKATGGRASDDAPNEAPDAQSAAAPAGGPGTVEADVLPLTQGSLERMAAEGVYSKGSAPRSQSHSTGTSSITSSSGSSGSSEGTLEGASPANAGSSHGIQLRVAKAELKSGKCGSSAGVRYCLEVTAGGRSVMTWRSHKGLQRSIERLLLEPAGAATGASGTAKNRRRVGVRRARHERSTCSRGSSSSRGGAEAGARLENGAEGGCGRKRALSLPSRSPSPPPQPPSSSLLHPPDSEQEPPPSFSFPKEACLSALLLRSMRRSNGDGGHTITVGGSGGGGGGWGAVVEDGLCRRRRGRNGGGGDPTQRPFHQQRHQPHHQHQQEGASTFETFDHIRETMQHFLSGLFERRPDLLLHDKLHYFLWDPISPTGSLLALAEEGGSQGQ